MDRTETILGVRFFNGTVDDAVATMSRDGGLLVVPAAPALVKLQSDEGYRRAVVSADMAIAATVPWARPIRARITGAAAFA